VNSNRCRSDDCPSPALKYGQRIVQIAKGRCFKGHITPTYTDKVVGEWHEKCYHEFPLRPQRMPYKCEECGLPIEHGGEVLYAIIGAKPASGYIRPEGRGHKLYLVKHVRCPEKQDTNSPDMEV
jgi:hypothetical protein